MAHSFLHHVEITHPSIWEFIDTLKLDASHNRMLIAQMLAGAAPPPHIKKNHQIKTIADILLHDMNWSHCQRKITETNMLL